MKKLKNLLFPKEKIIGLAVTHNSIRISLIERGGKIIYQGVIGLKEGTIKNGDIIDFKNFERSFSILLNQARTKAKVKKDQEIPTIVSYLTNPVYTKPITLPSLSKKDFYEALDLNLKLSSPLKEQAISDWQLVAKADHSPNSIILTAFIKAEIVEKIRNILIKQHLLLRAFEFHPLSLNRIINYYYSSSPNNYLILYINRLGIDISATIEKNIVFSFFNEWETEKLSQKEVISFVKRAIIQTTNYYQEKFPKNPLEKIFLAGDELDKEKLEKIKNTLEKNFLLETEIILNNSPVIISLGAALRGLTFFGEDRQISLSPYSVIEEYNLYQGKIFIRYWGKITVTVLSIITLTFLGNLIALKKIRSNLISSSKIITKNKNKIRIAAQLEKEAKEFNSLLKTAIELNEKTVYWDNFLKTVFKAKKESGIEIEKILIPSPSGFIRIRGSADSLPKINQFKEALSKDKHFKSIEIIPVSLKKESGKILFEIKLKYDFRD